MKDKENYVLLLNSQSATNRIGGSKRNYQYNINWSAILPKPENINQKYMVRFTMTGMTQTGFTDIWSLNIDFGGANVYQQDNSKSTYLGLVYPTNLINASTSGTNTCNYYTRATLKDNPPVCIEYPNNSLIIVNFLNINNSTSTTFNVEYYLTLEFTPI